LLDRIDLHVEVPTVEYRLQASTEVGESSGDVRERVVAARLRQLERFKNHDGLTCNAGF